MKIQTLTLQLLTLSSIALGLTACGTPKANPKLPAAAVTAPANNNSEVNSAAEDAEEAEREKAAEDAASIRRTIQLKKEQLVRLQGRLSLKEQLRNSVESRKTNAEASKAAAVPGQVSTSVSGSDGAAVISAVIDIRQQTRAGEKNAATQQANLGNLVTQIDAELKAANEVIDGIAKQIEALDLEIADLTIKLNGLSTEG